MNKCYVTMAAPPKHHQLTFEEMLMGTFDVSKLHMSSQTNTVTKHLDVNNKAYQKLKRITPTAMWIANLKQFNDKYYNTLMPQIKAFETLSDFERRNIKTQESVEKLYAKLGQVMTEEEQQSIIAKIDEANAAIANGQEKYAYRTFNLRKRGAPEHIPTFRLPEKYLRTINAPNHELKTALNDLKFIFEELMPKTYHTAAFAYVKKRSTIKAIQRHQNWESKWFAKFDFSNFFGSTTPEFLMSQMAQIYPLCEIMAREDGRAELSKALELCFLDGGLPQGTPISPLLTNIMMIPIDHALSNTLNSFEYPNGVKERFIYTRYADDLLISCRVDFNVKHIEDFIIKTLADHGAPFELNTSKTRYGSNAGSNWNLGVMLNKDNKITVGHENKRQLKAMLNNYFLDRARGEGWEAGELYRLQGKISYYKAVEPEAIDSIIDKFNAKYNTDVIQCIKDDLKP